MVLPAVIPLGGRLALGDRVVPPLGRMERWFTRHAPETTAWIVAIAGFLLAQDALARLGLGG